MADLKPYTEDTLFDGHIKCLQHRDGYRFSVDAVLLGNFVKPKKRARVLDLGCGNGIISLIMAYRYNDISITGLELQPDLARLSRKNTELNNLSERIRIIRGDLKEIKSYIPSGTFDMVVSNPPYRKIGTGRINPGTEQAKARHEQTADITDFVSAAAWAVKRRGRVIIIYPASRGIAVITEMLKYELEPKKILAIYSYPGSAATLLIVEAVKQGGEEMKLLPPFYIYGKKGGAYSPEMTEFYKP
jgi:tRNA1(Val) A37 N6-methylase TrmN6